MNLIFVKATNFKNTCSTCGKEIPAGSSCYWEKEIKANYHNTVACKPKEEKKEPGSSFQIVMDSALEKAIEEKISRRLRRAKECVDRELPEAKEYSDYYAIVSECLHQFYGEEAALAIAKSRERR